MNQSALIGGALLAGFALFLAARDRLTVYGAVLFGDKPGAEPAPSTSPTQGIVPGAGSFDPLDVFGNYGFGLGDILKSLPAMPEIPGFGGGDMGMIH